MKKEYTVRTYRIILNLVLGLFLAGLVFFIANGWLLTTVNSIIAAVVIYLIYIWLVILNNIIKITVSGNELIVKQGRKVRTFDIKACSFYAQTNSSAGETSCELTITEADGNQSFIDCELIGIKQFEQLLDDLGFNEAQNKVQALQAKKKDK